MFFKLLVCFSPLLLLVTTYSVEVENNKFTADSRAVRDPRCCTSSSSSSESSESGSSSSQEKGWRVVFNDPRSKSRAHGSKHCPCPCTAAKGSPYYCAFVASPSKCQDSSSSSSSSSSSESLPSPCSSKFHYDESSSSSSSSCS